VITGSKRLLLAGTVVLSALATTTGCTAGGREGLGRIMPAEAGEVPYLPPTPTSTAPPPPPPPREPETHSGKGNGEFTIEWPDRIGFVTFECPKCSANVMVNTDGSDSLLVNAIGPYKGTHWVNSRDGRPAKKITVRASSAWTFTISDGRDLPVAEAGKTLSGTGDAVVSLPGKTTTAAITGKGSGHFAVMVLPDDRTVYVSLPVNTSGGNGYQGTVPLAGPGLLQVDADAAWTITPA
jgi:hypothetical protein